MYLRSLLLSTSLAALALAKNDWNKPCFDGECSYDFPLNPGGQVGTLKIWGDNKHSIADITSASGWIILGCDPDALEQDIRIVCQEDESDINDCGHLFQSLGKSGKVVRLPESCGKNAFARLAKFSAHDDQHIPMHIASKLVRRTGQPPVVRRITVDTRFRDIDPSETGNVNIAIEGVSSPGPDAALLRRGARSALLEKLAEKRGLIDWVPNALNGFNNINISHSRGLPAVNVEKHLTLFDTSVSCPVGNDTGTFAATAKGDVSASVNAVVNLGIAAVGTIIPPNLSEFGVFAILNSGFKGQFQLAATASGTIITDLKEIFSVNLAGLSFPGILSIGPVFKLNGQATAVVDIPVTLTIGVAYNVTNAKLFYPKSTGDLSPGIGVDTANNDISLTVTPNVTSHTTAHALIQPRLDIGISAFSDESSTVFLAFDTTADTTLDLVATNTITTCEEDVPVAGEIQTRNVPGSVKGCADIKTGLDVHVGSTGPFFGLFDQNTNFDLFASRNIFQKCWGIPSGCSGQENFIGAQEVVPGNMSCPTVNVQAVGAKLV